MTTEELETSTAMPEPAKPATPYKIAVSYFYGKKGKHSTRIIDTAFEDVETSEHLMAILNHLAKEHQEPNISPFLILPLSA